MGSSNPLAALEALSDLLSGTSQRLKTKFGQLPRVDPAKLIVLAARDQHEMQKQRANINSFSESLVSRTKLAELSRWADVVDATYPDLQPRGMPFTQIFAQTDAYPGRPAFRLLLGRLKVPTLVIAVRGTFSMHDVLTDILLDDVAFNGGLAHGGFMESGRGLTRKVRGAVLEFERTFPGSPVVCIGHSLGAAVAAIVAVELRSSHVSDTATALGFAMPRFLSQRAAESAKPFITSVVNASDFVCRASEQSLLELHARVNGVEWLDASPMPIPSSLQWLLKSQVKTQITQSSSSSPPPSSYSTFKMATLLRERLLSLRKMMELMISTPERDHDTFVVPGDIVYFFERDRLGVAPDPVAIHVGPYDEKIRDICLSQYAVRDHLWTSYRAIFDSLCTRFDVSGTEEDWHFPHLSLDELDAARWDGVVEKLKRSCVNIS